MEFNRTDGMSPRSMVVKASSNSEAKSPSKSSAKASKKLRRSQTVDEMILFQPVKYPRGGFDRLEIEGQRVKFQSEDGTQLDGRFFRVPQPQATVLFFHGNGGNLASRTTRMDQLSKNHQVNVFLMDYRGYGRSEGKPTVDGVLADGRAALRKAAELSNIRTNEVIVMGRSLGGAVAVDVATEFQTKGLIVESSFSSFRELAKHHAGFLHGIVPKTRLNSAEKIKDYRGNLLMSHGTSDGVVPFRFG